MNDNVCNNENRTKLYAKFHLGKLNLIDISSEEG